MLPEYGVLAKELRIERCRGIQPNGQTCHENHDGSIANGLVHWSDRRPTRAGIRRFLHLGAMVKTLIIQPPGTPLWLRYYRSQLLVQAWADKLRMRFPASVSDQYRAELRAMVSNLPASTPGREEALRWTSR